MEVLATPIQALSAGQAGTQGTEPAFASYDDLRVQTRCCLTVRIAWDVSSGHHHPPFTFTCAEDTEMAATAALRAAEVAHQGIRFAGVAVSATGRKYGPWVPLDLGGRL